MFDLAGPEMQAKRCEGLGFVFVVPQNARNSNKKYSNPNPSPVGLTGALPCGGDYQGAAQARGGGWQRAWSPCPFCSEAAGSSPRR